MTQYNFEALTTLCEEASPEQGFQALLTKLAPALNGHDFTPVAERGGWYRLGGVIDAEGKRISDDLVAWVEQEADGDLDQLLANYGDLGYRVTRRQGKTHYFTSSVGDRPEDFVQLEVEEIEEVVDHLLFDPEQPVEDLEELLDPMEYNRLTPTVITPAAYHFRRVTAIHPLVDAMREGDRKGASALVRFMSEWSQSSAREHLFCEHWILMLRTEMGTNGETGLSAKPSHAYKGKLPEIKLDDDPRGLDLANRIHAFDRELGYPFAWYFIMLTHRAVPHEMAQKIHDELMGAYDYLPARDLKILRNWSDRPYGV